jgi:steroid delta-isomerase-like uncharacterized protein
MVLRRDARRAPAEHPAGESGLQPSAPIALRRRWRRHRVRPANEAEEETMSVDANKAVVHAFVAAWNSGDLDRLGMLMADDCVLDVGGETVSCSPTATRAIAADWRGAFPDYRFDLLDLIGEGDKVVARMPFTGTQTGPLMGMPATGRAVRVSEIVIFRVVGGKIVEAWEEYDELGMRRQLGVLPAGAST